MGTPVSKILSRLEEKNREIQRLRGVLQLVSSCLPMSLQKRVDDALKGSPTQTAIQTEELTVRLAQHGHFWTVEEISDGRWSRSALGHAWALEDDARQQCQELRARYGSRIFRVAEYGSPEKAAGCPTHGLEHFFEGMCIECGSIPAVEASSHQTKERQP